MRQEKNLCTDVRKNGRNETKENRRKKKARKKKGYAEIRKQMKRHGKVKTSSTDMNHRPHIYV